MGIEKQIGVVCLVVLMVGAVACGRTPMQKRDQFLGSGRRLFERKEYARAVLDFKNAAAAMPRDAEAYYQLGRAYAAYGELQSAVYSFRRAIDRNPKHAGAQLELSKIMAATIDPEILQDAESRLTALLQDGAAGPEALNALAFTQLKLGKSDLAMRNLQMALAMAPQSLNSSILMAQAKLGQRNWKGAEEALQTACANAPSSPEARVVLGHFYVTRSRFSEAEQQFQQALSLDPKHPSALLEIGKLELQAGKTQEADETFKRLSALPNPTTKPAHALFLLQEGRKEEAIREFEGLAKSNPEDREARTRLVAAYQSAGKSLDADRVLTAALKNNRKDLDALLQRGEMYLAERKFQLAETDLNQVLREKPSSAEVHYVLAKLHAARETVLLERQELSEALRLNPMRLQVRLELVQLLLRNNGAKSAIEILNETPVFQQQTLAFLTQRNWVLWALGDLKELEKGVDQGLAAVRTPDLLIQNGLLKLRHGDFKAARTSLEEAMRIDPQDLRALDVIRRSYMAQKQMPIAVQKVKEYAAGSPRSAPVQEFLGSVLMGSGDRKGARAAFEAAKEADKTFEQSEMSLIQLDYAEGRVESAKDRLKRILSANPTNTRANLWLGNLEAKAGDAHSALQSFQQVLKVDPGHPQALNNTAFLLVAYGNQPDEALKYAEKAHELAPANPDYSDTLGWILYRKGIYSSAARYLEAAASQGGNVVWRYHLAMAYAKAGQSAQARATLKAALKANPNLPEAKEAVEVVGSATP